MKDIPFPKDTTARDLRVAGKKARPKEVKVKRRQRDMDAEYLARLRNGKTVEKGSVKLGTDEKGDERRA